MATKIVCVKHGTRYDANYVNILFDMVMRNLPPTPIEFICFTDDPAGLHEQIKVRGLPVTVKGWWNKLYLFKEGVFEPDDRIIYFDLDTVITGALDALLAYDGDFAILRDFYRSGGYQSSVLLWRGGFGAEIWESFAQAGYPDLYGGDQAWIETQAPGADLLQNLYPDFFRSYKVSCTRGIPRGCRIVVFHGEPRPHQVTEGWVPKIWKIGGGSALELCLVGNTPEDKLVDNVRHAMGLGLETLNRQPAHGGHAVIVGGAPSVKACVADIRLRQKNGQQVFAINNAHQFLLQHGIFADYHVMVDARAENARFVPLNGHTRGLYASQCHPEVFLACARPPLLWHDESAKLVANKLDSAQTLFVSGGSTAGLKALCLAYLLGFRQLHIFGLDSCYEGLEAHHAYEQSLNDGERVLTVEFTGKSFNASPWMIRQAQEFLELVPQLLELGCELSVHGEGLIPHIARAGFAPAVGEGPADSAKYGMAWPANAEATRIAAEATLGDLERIMEYVPVHGIAVQAGGSAGLWPRKMAEKFDLVYTFEPDPLSYKCLNINCPEPHILRFRAALGDRAGTAGLRRIAGNPGANHLAEGEEVQVMTIDSLNLPRCDLIQLDVEGYEIKALEGAVTTIAKYHPVIAVEDKGHSERYGVAQGAVIDWLAAHGYALRNTFNRDLVFTTAQQEKKHGSGH
jgi:FkbM family methyltransferase